MTVKTCTKCKIEKPINCFHKNKNEKDELKCWCKNCTKRYDNEYYINNRPKILEKGKNSPVKKAYRKRTKKKQSRYNIFYKKNNLAKVMIHQSRRRARQKEIEHTITEQDIQDLLDQRRNNNGKYICPILGVEMKVNAGSGKCNLPDSISLDRIDVSKGYVVGNVDFISRRANSIKNNGTIAEHEKIIQYMKEHLLSQENTNG